MNNPKLKKFLTLLICLMLVASVCLLAACNKDTDPAVDDETKTYSPTFTNGNFTSSTASDSGYPYAPSSWTGSPTANIEGIFSLDNLVAGTVSLAKDAYEANKSKWDNLAWFDKNTADLSEDYTADSDVLMIYNKELSYYLYKSGTFTATANGYYKLSIDVRTSNILGVENTDNAEAGATLLLCDSNGVGIAEFDAVKSNDTWTRYSFYIHTKSSSATLQLRLGLGKETTDTTNTALTSGYAFFDNVQFSALENGNEDYVAAANSATLEKVDLTVPNAEFDYTASATTASKMPAFYSKASGVGTAEAYGQIDIAHYAKTLAALGLAETTVNPGLYTDCNARYSNVYAISTTSSMYGFRTTSALSFTRGNAYLVSVWVNTKNVESGSAYVALTANSTDAVSDGISFAVPADNGWTECKFIIVANQNTTSSQFLQLWLGSSADKATGTAFFDGLTVTKLDLTEHDLAYYQAEESVAAAQTLDETDSITDNYIYNGYFKQDATGNVLSTASDANWIEYETNTGVNNDGISVSVISADEDVSTAYATISTNVLKISTTAPTIYGLGYNRENAGAIKALKAYSYYRFSVWVKTEDVQSTAGVTLKVYFGNEAIATFSNVNTGSMSESDGLNGYRELVCYLATNENVSENVSLEFQFGAGTQWTSTTLFDGTAYISNASLIETTYAKFNSASASGTYEKKYNCNETVTGSFKNDQFDAYDMTNTKGFTTDGIVDSEFQNTTFGVPSGWVLKKDSGLAEVDGLYAGVVDFNRGATFINNLITAATADGITDLAVLNDQASFMISSCADSSDPEKLSYVGENSVLMLSAPNADNLPDGDNFVSMNYLTETSVTLAANTYYEISVLVKTLGNSRASVYLVTDNRAEADAGSCFTNIKETNVYNGWTKYTFRIEVGFSSVTASLGLYLGGSNNPEDALDAGASIGGTVFFDLATLTTIDKEAYDADIASEDTTKKVSLTVDSFGTTSTTHSDTGAYIKPTTTTWTSSTNAAAETNSKAGIVINSEYPWETQNPELESILVGHNGSNSALVINNAEKIYTNFTSGTAMTFAKNSYYKVSVWGKTWNVADGDNAYIKLALTGYTDNSEYKIGNNTIYFNTNVVGESTDVNEYQQFTFFVKTPEDADLSKIVKLTLGLGESGDDINKQVQGIAVFDDVEIQLCDKEAYDAAAADELDSTSAVSYLKIDDTTVTPDDPTNPTDNDNGNYNWIIFTSVAFGAIIVIVVIIYFVKKYLPKRKEKKVSEKKTDKQKEDKYKNLND